MILNKIELKKIMYEFNSICSRLTQADFNDYTNTLKKFVAFIKDTPILYDYILSCGECTQDISDEINSIEKSYRRQTFSIGDTKEEEVRDVFAIVDYISNNNIQVQYSIGLAYTSSTKFQDGVKAFTDRVVMILIRHLETFLTELGYDMGVDDHTFYNITMQNGQLNIATDNATITATNSIEFDRENLEELIKSVKAATEDISDDDKELVEGSLGIIEDEVKSPEPQKGALKAATKALSAIKGTVEFGAAATALVQFIASVFF